MMSYAKGKRFRLVGRHTQEFLNRAAKRSNSELQKRVFFIAAVCSDELIASLLKLDDKPIMTAFKKRQVKRRTTITAITAAMRIYLSALLVAISSHKAILLEKIQIQETDLLEIWCWIYGYQPTDMTTFNDVLVPIYQQKHLDGVAEYAGAEIAKIIYEDTRDLTKSEAKAIAKALTSDASAILRVII